MAAKGRRIFIFILAAILAWLSACQTAMRAAASRTDQAERTAILLSDSGCAVSGTGAAVNGNRIDITDGGVYILSGSLRDGQIYVEAGSTDAVTLILDGMSLINETEAAVYIKKATEVQLKLAAGTENLIQSGTAMPPDVSENASGGALYTKEDLSISGSGSLTVRGYIKDGIHGEGSLFFEGGSLTVEAANHAVKANDSLHVSDGDLELTAGTDGLHSEDELRVDGGNIRIFSGDDGMHADTTLTVYDGSVNVVESYEGLEGNRIYVKGGSIAVNAQDDGINANGGWPWQDSELVIDGGSIYVNAGGDGLDSNGDLIINGGIVIVDGPENDLNGAIDSGRETGGVCAVNGGTIMAVGASGMAESFGSASRQNSICLTVAPAGPGTKILIADASGNGIFAYSPAKRFSSVVFSSPDLETGREYTVTVGNKSTAFTQNEGTCFANVL